MLNWDYSSIWQTFRQFVEISVNIGINWHPWQHGDTRPVPNLQKTIKLEEKPVVIPGNECRQAVSQEYQLVFMFFFTHLFSAEDWWEPNYH